MVTYCRGLLRSPRCPGPRVAPGRAGSPAAPGRRPGCRPADQPAGGQQAPAPAAGRGRRDRDRPRPRALLRAGPYGAGPRGVLRNPADHARDCRPGPGRAGDRGPPDHARAAYHTHETRGDRMTTAPTGRIEHRDGRHVLVQTREFRAPIEDVWAAVTERERLARWIGTWTGDP